MDKRQKRTQAKMEAIKQTALELFAKHGVEKVTMDEIADAANASKVTIYKYFGSKDDLYADVIDMYIEETLSATEEVFTSDMDFLEKLKFALLQSTNTSPLVSWSYLLKVWEQNAEISANMQEKVQSKVKVLMQQLIEEGKQKGYIEKDLSFELLFLYSEIFRAGLRAKSIDIEATLVDKNAVEDLLHLYYFGIIKRP
jgi:AcrR family transcriptional regulator